MFNRQAFFTAYLDLHHPRQGAQQHRGATALIDILSSAFFEEARNWRPQPTLVPFVESGRQFTALPIDLTVDPASMPYLGRFRSLELYLMRPDDPRAGDPAHIGYEITRQGYASTVNGWIQVRDLNLNMAMNVFGHILSKADGNYQYAHGQLRAEARDEAARYWQRNP